MGTRTNSGDDVKGIRKRRERESDKKWWMKGASKAATERGTYAGGSNRMGVKRKPEVTKTLDRRSLREGNCASRARDPPPNEQALGNRECNADTWEEQDEMRQRDAG